MTGSRRVGAAAALLAALVLALALVGCSPVSQATPSPSPSPLAKPTQLPDSPAVTCGDGNATLPLAPSSTLWLGADGAWFHTGLVGVQSDTTVAVFVHQSDLGVCGWWPYAQYLAKHGVRSMMLNLCGWGATRCPSREPVIGSGAKAVLAAARWARAHGATRIVAVGASMGGTTTVLAASEDKDHVLDAVADLSGPISYLDGDISEAGHTITVPSFLAVAPSDPVVGTGEMEGLASSIRSPKPILHLDGAGHGWDLLHDPYSKDPFDPLAVELTDFVLGT